MTASLGVCLQGAMEASRAEIRWRIIHMKQDHKDWSFRKIGLKTGVNHSTVKAWIDHQEEFKNVKDKSRSGRKPLVHKPALNRIKSKAIQKDAQHAFSASGLAELLQQEVGAVASPRTVSRVLRACGWRYGYAKKVLLLSATHRQKRLAWAKKHLRQRVTFAKWMFTDSKVFLLHKTAGKAGVKVWYPEDCRPECPIAKNSRGVHVYLGVTVFGITEIIFVTGAGRKSVYINTKTGLAYSGVSAIEYQKDVLPILIKSGNRIFSQHAEGRWASQWVFQQDNARPHVAQGTKDLLHQLMPNRVEHAWPAMSPDLSWIENIWSWAERKLQKKYPHIQTIEELESKVQEVLKSVPPKILKSHVDSMVKRLHKVVKNNGGPIV